jgi:hypothetical protein
MADRGRNDNTTEIQVTEFHLSTQKLAKQQTNWQPESVKHQLWPTKNGIAYQWFAILIV